MNQEPDPRQRYQNHGAALLQGLFAPEIVAAISYQLSEQVARTGTAMLAPPSLGDKPCYEAYGYALPVLATFLWGLTPQIETLTGCRLLPTYCYFRTYQQGDVCRVHTDRPACEHSLSLTLGYADGIAWALSVSERPLAPEQIVAKFQDNAARVQFQAAFTLGQLRDARALDALSELALQRGSDQWFRLAILSSAANEASLSTR